MYILRLKQVLGVQLNILAEKEQRKWRFSVKLRRFRNIAYLAPYMSALGASF